MFENLGASVQARYYTHTPKDLCVPSVYLGSSVCLSLHVQIEI